LTTEVARPRWRAAVLGRQRAAAVDFRRLSQGLHGVSYGQAFDKNSTSELIAAHLDGPVNGALNTVPEVLFIAGGVTLRKADRTVIAVSGAPAATRTKPARRKR